MKKLALKISLLLLLFLALFAYIAYDYLSGFLIHGGRTRSDYYRPQNVACNEWHHNETFKDHRVEPKPNAAIQIPSCEQAQKTPKREFYLLNRDRMRIRYLLFNEQDELAEDAPLWLHVHGITSSWLHGIRYLDAAKRLGFRLVVMEMQNHGKSQRHREGSSWGCREKWDVIGVLDQLQKRFPQSKLLITASSMGTITTSLAAIEAPSLFQHVKALVYESPISSVTYTINSMGEVMSLPNFVTQMILDTTLALAKKRSSIDFRSCFPDPNTHSVEIPTLLLLSEQEFSKTAQRTQFREYPYHRWLDIYPLERGTHSAYWNYQPEAFEAAIAGYWQQVNSDGLPP